ncbi:MAG: PPC domain-containing protein [Verrucomicrobia subdivision 3 bacterium]|nr:PPC domain-containing protein [Limisphaerales bacterium]
MKLNGSRLEGAQEIVFYSPGIQAGKIDSTKGDSARVRFKIAPDCRLGEHQLRVRTSAGVSDLRTFWVGPFPELAEKEPNNEMNKPQTVPLNTTVVGAAGGEDVDYYQVLLKQGERLSVEIEAIRLGRALLDSYIAVHDSAGKVLAASDDTALLMQDSALTFVAPKGAVYTIQVRETSYGGAADTAYRLHVGTFPRPTAVFPAGGKAGEELEVTFIGDAAGNFTQKIKLPLESESKCGAFAEKDGRIAPSPNWMRVSTFPNILEAEPNNAREQATGAYTDLPVALNGILSKGGDGDWFKFDAKKGQSLEISVHARRLRTPVDSVLAVFDSKGESLGSNDDSAGADSTVKLNVPADGQYFVRITDHLNQGGPDYVYRVEVTIVQPTVTLSIPQVARNDSQSRQFIAVPRGNRFATMISARRANFSGDLVFSIDGLPTGIRMNADTMAGKVDAMPIVFEAAADAPSAGKLLELTAKPAESDKSVRSHFCHQVEFINGPNNTFYYHSLAEKLYVAVIESAPFKVYLSEPKVPLVQRGSMDLKVNVERKADFDEPINVKMMWNPPGVGSQPDITIPKGANAGIYQLNATGNADLREWKIAVLASATVRGGPMHVSSQLTKLEIGEPFVTGKIQTLAASPGEAPKLICKLDQKKPFDGKATLRLMGLPDKITAPELEITSEDKEAVFNLTIDPKCPFGSHKNLFCAAEIKHQSQTIPHNIGAGGVLRVVPPKKADTKVAATSSGKAK